MRQCPYKRFLLHILLIKSPLKVGDILLILKAYWKERPIPIFLITLPVTNASKVGPYDFRDAENVDGITENSHKNGIY